MRDFRKLQIWEKSHELTLKIYELTSEFLVKKYMDLRVKFGVRVPQFQQILPKAVGEKVLLNSSVFCK